MMNGFLNCRVSSDVEELEKLRVLHPWLPGREHVRPPPEQKQRKLEYFSHIRDRYVSEADYALQTVFGFAPEDDPVTGKLKVVVDPKMARTRRFDRNLFPYALPEGSKHWTMWYMPDQPSDEEVSRDIAHDIGLRTGGSKFEFAWYPNPKMTIPTVPHVQVFWHRLP